MEINNTYTHAHEHKHICKYTNYSAYSIFRQRKTKKRSIHILFRLKQIYYIKMNTNKHIQYYKLQPT